MGALEGGRRVRSHSAHPPSFVFLKEAPHSLTWVCSWVHSGPAAGSCCTQRRSFCLSHCSGPYGHPLHTGAPPGGEKRRCKVRAWVTDRNFPSAC